MLTKIYKIAKNILPKKSSSNTCIAKNRSIRNMTVLKVEKRLMNHVKPLINRKKNWKHNITPNHQNNDPIENMRVIPYRSSKIRFLTDSKLDSITLSVQEWTHDHTWQYLKTSEAFDHLRTKEARLIIAHVAFHWWRHSTQLWGDCCKNNRRAEEV